MAKENIEKPIAVFMCSSSDMHPYACEGYEGAGKCEHCDKKKYEGHDPEICALCNDI